MRLSALAIFLALLAACGQPARVEVRNVWARDTVGRTANAAVFMTISSNSGDRLLGASAPVARKTDLMTMQSDEETISMKYIDAIVVPAGGPVFLDPAGLHVWLADLERPLKSGESFPLTLEFEKAGPKQVTVYVLGPAAIPPSSAMDM